MISPPISHTVALRYTIDKSIPCPGGRAMVTAVGTTCSPPRAVGYECVRVLSCVYHVRPPNHVNHAIFIKEAILLLQ